MFQMRVRIVKADFVKHWRKSSSWDFLATSKGDLAATLSRGQSSVSFDRIYLEDNKHCQRHGNNNEKNDLQHEHQLAFSFQLFHLVFICR